MKKIFLFLTMALFTIATVNAQNLNASNGGYAKKRKIDGKKFRVTYYEYEVKNTSIDEVWEELSGNYVNIGRIHKAIDSSSCESGDTTQGLGASRYCSIDFAGKELEIKERIIDVKEEANRKEFTYDVYEATNFPAKVYNTWVVRKDANGKVYIGNVFIMRGKPSIMTGVMVRKLRKLKSQRNSVIAFVHFFQTGETKVDNEVLEKLYPEVSNNL